MTVVAVDVPRNNASARTATALVVINVARNPNAPVFDQADYSIEITEYTSMRTAITTVRATDADPVGVRIEATYSKV